MQTGGASHRGGHCPSLSWPPHSAVEPLMRPWPPRSLQRNSSQDGRGECISCGRVVLTCLLNIRHTVCGSLGCCPWPADSRGPVLPYPPPPPTPTPAQHHFLASADSITLCLKYFPNPPASPGLNCPPLVHTLFTSAWSGARSVLPTSPCSPSPSFVHTAA